VVVVVVEDIFSFEWMVDGVEQARMFGHRREAVDNIG
jgi:hypothetical protein